MAKTRTRHQRYNFSVLPVEESDQFYSQKSLISHASYNSKHLNRSLASPKMPGMDRCYRWLPLVTGMDTALTRDCDMDLPWRKVGQANEPIRQYVRICKSASDKSQIHMVPVMTLQKPAAPSRPALCALTNMDRAGDRGVIPCADYGDYPFSDSLRCVGTLWVCDHSALWLLKAVRCGKEFPLFL